MTTLTRSTSHRLLTPQLAALALAALRLGIVVERKQMPLPTDHRKWICRVEGCAAHPDTDWNANDHFLCDRCSAEIGRRLDLEEGK